MSLQQGEGPSPELGPVFCFTGEGAGLNDVNGTERDGANNYLYPGSIRCHVVWYNGYETYAAKRPATTSYPLPGKVNIHSPILWRPVASGVTIAN